MTFKIRLAGIVIEIEHLYPEIRKYCRDYVIEENDTDPDYHKNNSEVQSDRASGVAETDVQLYVRTTEALIERERQETDAEQGMVYQPGYLETLAVLRQIADYMPETDGFLMHGAVVSWNGKAYMFTAPSGTGKSTHIRLWRQYLGPKVHIINGDKPLLTANGTEVTVYGTPWAGKEQWQENTQAPLSGICILKRGRENRIRSLSPAEALTGVLRQIYFTDDETQAGRVMELADRMLAQVPVYELECDISEEAVRCSFEKMTGEIYEKGR